LNDNVSTPPENGPSEIAEHRAAAARPLISLAPDEVALICRSYATNIKFDHRYGGGGGGGGCW